MFHKKVFILVNYISGQPGILAHKTYTLSYNNIFSSKAETVEKIIEKLHLDLFHELNNKKYIITNIQVF